MKEKVLIVGHRNPDSDSICSAIAYAELKTKRNRSSRPKNRKSRSLGKKPTNENVFKFTSCRS